MKNINFGIDLGTTNSGIGKFENGKVTIFKNPVGFNDTLPSVVSFRKGRLQVGDKAREQLRLNSDNVVSSFKRRMGTGHLYTIPDTAQELTPVELSAIVLKELLNFVPDDKPESIVITIPASFDTIQSNATKKAGYAAGFKEVVLLQEPIAACLAYANLQDIDISEKKTWLVYDFGGGTFDAAIVTINERELRVADHKGNNFLGGLDIDNLIVEHVLCPALEVHFDEPGLWQKLQSGDPFYTKLYFELLYRAEEAKKELSVKGSSIVEIDIEDKDIFAEIEISRDAFNKVIYPMFDESLQLTQQLLQENGIQASDVERIILVGGTTYIPYIRKQLKEKLGIATDSTIDPTTAVIVGAAYYAGSKQAVNEESETQEINPAPATIDAPELQLIFENNSKDSEELIMGIMDGFAGYYRITRKDGGFDTGLLTFSQKFTEFVTVMPRQGNGFTINIYDVKQNSIISRDITINQGIYNILGQPLPNDICIELDDRDGTTYLEKIFKKNDILPLTKTIYKTLSRTIVVNSEDKLVINIAEGKAGTLPGSNLSIGYIEIKGTDISGTLLRGMDIELKFSMTESRDLKVSVYISSLDMEINETFNPHQRSLAVDKMISEISPVIDDIDHQLYFAEDDEDNFLYYAKLKNIRDGLEELLIQTRHIGTADATDRKFSIDEKKRRYLQEWDDLTRHKLVLKELEEYKDMRETAEFYLTKASPSQKEEFLKIIRNEKEVLQSNEKAIIRRKTKELSDFANAIYREQDEAYISLFVKMKVTPSEAFTDASTAKRLVDTGEKALSSQNYKELRYIAINLYNLLKVKPKHERDDDTFNANLGIR